MRAVSVLLLTGFVAAGSMQPFSWNNSQEYRFRYTSQVLSGIPEINNQYSGVRLSAEVRVQPQADSTCKVQIQQPRFISYNGVLDVEHRSTDGSKGFAPESQGEEEHVSGSVKSHLEAPFTVYHKKGLVQKIQTGAQEPQFIVNIKKAITAQFQHNFGKAEPKGVNNQIMRGQPGEVVPEYTSQESSPVGECETVYTINKLPTYMANEFEEQEQRETGHSQPRQACQGKEYYEIVKAKNLNNCTQSPVFHRSVGLTFRAEGGDASLPKQSSITRTIICGTITDHVIRKSTTAHGIHLNSAARFEANEKIHVQSKSSLVLMSVGGVQQAIPTPSSPKGYPSLVFEYSQEGRQGSQSTRDQASQPGQQARIPDLRSAPQVFRLLDAPESQIIEETTELFYQLIQLQEEKLSETSKSGQDISRMSTVLQTGVAQLSYDGLKKLEKLILSKVGSAGQERAYMIEQLFYDITTSAGTNPSVLLIKDKILSGKMSQEPNAWSWIISQAFRAIRTPTEELLGELVQLMKSEQVNGNRIIRASYLLGLTELVNKACVNPITMKSEYPSQFYGQLCSPESQVIKDQLIPYLVQKLHQSASSDMNSVITYVNALGNLGLKESTEELLKVVEGKISTSPHPRSVAVYRLIRPAAGNPSLYRPIFLAIIENAAECEQVRMAAVTALTYCAPSSADLQRLAIRTWFEPSRQVASYITSTLQTLSQIPETATAYLPLRQKAKAIVEIAKPCHGGIQTSHNLQTVQFIQAIKAAVSHKLQWITSEESVIPRSIFTKASLQGESADIDGLEAAYYIQGAESVIEKLQELYSTIRGQSEGRATTQNKMEVEELMRKLGVQGETAISPEAHLTLKFMGLQKLYSFDSQYVTKVITDVSRAFIEGAAKFEQGVTNKYFKILNLASTDMLLPTESGMLTLVFARSPTVAYNKAHLKTVGQTQVQLKVKGTANYERLMSVGVVSAFTNKFHGCNVDTAMHIANRFNGEMSLRSSQVSVSIKNSDEPEFRSEKPFLEYSVLPITTTYELRSLKSLLRYNAATKIIKSRHALKQRETQVGKLFGLDLQVKEESEESLMDVYKLWEDLKVNVPVFLTTLPTAIQSTSRRTTIRITYNPKTSTTKQFDFNFRLGYGSKQAQEQLIQEIPYHNIETEKEVLCTELAPEQIQSCRASLDKQLSVDSDIYDSCESSQTEQEKSKCRQERQLIKEAKKLCQQGQEKCSVLYELAMQRQEARQQLKSSLQKIQGGQAMSISYGAKLRGWQQAEDRSIQGQVVIAEKMEKENREETEVSMKMSVQTPYLRKPLDAEINANGKIQRPSARWNREEILGQDLQSKIEVEGQVGLRGEEKQRISASITASRSQEQKQWAQQSQHQAQCSRDESEGRKLSKSCKIVRQAASSLDKVQAKLTLPRMVADNQVTGMITEVTKFAFLPYVTEQKSLPKSKLGNEVEYTIEAHVSHQGRNGRTLSARIAGNGEEVEYKNVRVGAALQGLLPIDTQAPLATRVLQQLTDSNAQSSCSIESGLVKTFDKLAYNYTLNDCEHVVFAEAATRPRVVVTAKQSPQHQTIMVVVDGHKYEIEIKRQNRWARSNGATIKVNGETKVYKKLESQQEIQQQGHNEYLCQHKNYYDNVDTYVSNSKDGVYSIVAGKYGVEVVADGERMEVKSYQHQFRNQVTGLCGDLNGEKTADLKSGKKCTMTSPRLAASSFMLVDGKCRGISQEIKSQLNRQQQKCVKKIEVPTKVSSLFQTISAAKPAVQLRHLIQESQGLTCFSKEMVRVCQGSYPKTIEAKQAEFVCKASSSAAAQYLKRRAMAGELIEELTYQPTSRYEMIHAPSQC